MVSCGLQGLFIEYKLGLVQLCLCIGMIGCAGFEKSERFFTLFAAASFCVLSGYGDLGLWLLLELVGQDSRVLMFERGDAVNVVVV